MKLTFKRCDQNDLRELVSISRNTYFNAFIADNSPENMQLYLDSAFSKSVLADDLKNKESDFYFAFHMDVVVGYFKINWGKAQKDMNDKDGFEIERIYVLKEFLSLCKLQKFDNNPYVVKNKDKQIVQKLHHDHLV